MTVGQRAGREETDDLSHRAICARARPFPNFPRTFFFRTFFPGTFFP